MRPSITETRFPNTWYPMPGVKRFTWGENKMDHVVKCLALTYLHHQVGHPSLTLFMIMPLISRTDMSAFLHSFPSHTMALTRSRPGLELCSHGA